MSRIYKLQQNKNGTKKSLYCSMNLEKIIIEFNKKYSSIVRKQKKLLRKIKLNSSNTIDELPSIDITTMDPHSGLEFDRIQLKIEEEKNE